MLTSIRWINTIQARSIRFLKTVTDSDLTTSLGSSFHYLYSEIRNSRGRVCFGHFLGRLLRSASHIASLSGTYTNEITQTFPRYPLTEVPLINVTNKPKTRFLFHDHITHVGGEVHLMIGVKYLCYHLRLIFQLLYLDFEFMNHLSTKLMEDNVSLVVLDQYSVVSINNSLEA